MSALEITCNRPGCWGFWSGDVGNQAEAAAWDRRHEAECPTPPPPTLRKYQSAIDDVLAIARDAEHEHLRWEEPLWPLPSWINEIRAALDRRDDRCPCSQCQDAPRRIKHYRGIEVNA